MKQNKILSALLVAFTLTLAACGGGNGGSGEGSKEGGKSSKHTHEAAPDAPWQSNDTQHWKDCKDNDGGQAEKGSHKWEADASKQDKAATCLEEGIAYEICSVCGKTRERKLDKADHTFQKDATTGEDAVEWTTEPSCEAEGVGTKHCTVCDQDIEYSEPALGHVYAKDATTGEDVVEWVSEATCTKVGVGTKECTRCHVKASVTTPALGHDLQPEPDDGVAPKEDFAKVRMYSCTHNCGKSYFGFNADEVTAASKEHLVIDENGGARFWGRPIGNDVELDETGSASEDSHEAVFNENQPGDFFEYKFTLTDEQVGKYYLYCDATPAQWMRNNGLDFFAAKASDTDWTRGYYTDDIPETEENEKGTPIYDYRYILYVDGQPKAFDPEITNPVTSDNRAEFILPYEFNLHSGDNSISLRMAGGYRSTFHKFTFRSIEEKEPEHEHVWIEEAMEEPATGEALVKRFVCADPTCTEKVKYEIAAKTANMQVEASGDWKTDPATSSDGAFKLNNGKTATFSFALPKGFSGKMYQRCYMDSYNSNKNKKMFYETNNHCNIEVKVNNNAIDFSQFATTTFVEVFGNDLNGSNSLTKDVELGEVALVASNTVSYKRVETLNMLVTHFVFIGNDANA